MFFKQKEGENINKNIAKILEIFLLKKLGFIERIETVALEELEGYYYPEELKVLKKLIEEENKKSIKKRNIGSVVRAFHENLNCKKRSKASMRDRRDNEQRFALGLPVCIREKWQTIISGDEKLLLLQSVNQTSLPYNPSMAYRTHKKFGKKANFIVAMQINDEGKVTRAIITMQKIADASVLLKSLTVKLNTIDSDYCKNDIWREDAGKLTIIRMLPSKLDQYSLIQYIEKCAAERSFN